jgi:predicted DCC family thiol-disulfide oxidoreductase YuxK
MTPGEPTLNAPPARPLLLFDGDCGFCRFWVERWRSRTGDRVDYAAAQQEAMRFPQVTEEAWRRAAQLMMPDGTTYAGAEAVFVALACVPRYRWLLGAYRRVPGLRQASDAFYRFVAGHRDFFARLTRFGWGRDPRPSSYLLSRWLYVRLLGLVYAIAFLSLFGQIVGLVGERGLLPAAGLLEDARNNFGAEAYRLFPTLAWISASDTALKFLCAAGAVFGFLAMLGVLTRPALACAWLFYLSLMNVGQDFLSFQWDALLLETGFLAIFFSPQAGKAFDTKGLIEPPWRRGFPAVSSVVLWLQRWLLFRLMFLSGAVKLLSGDPSWRDLTALNYHYWTQPLPTPVAWYAAQLPEWFQKFSVATLFAVELAVPFLIFAPRRLRHFGALVMISLEVLIALTGNYCFFNLLTIALCLLLLDDSFLLARLPANLAARVRTATSAAKPALHQRPTAKIARTALAAIILIVSGTQMLQVFRHGDLVPGFIREWPTRLAPFNLVNSYGLFAVMTTSRVEIVIEGSDDGQTWQPYEFKYKPGDLARRPAWVAPYQPRLDWQLWFAALGNYQANRWFTRLMTRLLQGAPEATALLGRNPFPDAPPRYIRAVSFQYRFTDFTTRRATGDWWQRDRERLYFPTISLRPQ